MAKQDVAVKFSLQDGISSGLAKIKRGIGDVAASVISLNQGAELVGKTFNALKMPVDAFTAGIQGAANFEDAIARVGAVTGKTGDDLRDLGEQVRQAASETRFSSEQAAAGLNALAREGLSADDALKALSPTLNLAQANSVDLTAAAGQLADSMGAFGVSADSAVQAADGLQAAIQAGGTSFNDITEAMIAAGPAAKQAGASFDEVTAALGVLAENSIEGGKAGKLLKGLFTDLIDPSSKFSKELDKLGIKSRDFGTVIQELAARGSGAESAIRALGDNGAVALRELLDNGGGDMRRFIEIIKDSEGAAEKAADALDNTFNGALQRLKNSLSDLRDRAFEDVLKPFTEAFQRGTDAINEFAESPAFERAKTALANLFSEGIRAFESFVGKIDFETVTDDIVNFANSAGRYLGQLKESAVKASDGIGTISDAITRLKILNLEVGNLANLPNGLENWGIVADEAAREFDRVNDEIMRLKLTLPEGREAAERVTAAFEALAEAGAKVVNALHLGTQATEERTFAEKMFGETADLTMQIEHQRPAIIKAGQDAARLAREETERRTSAEKEWHAVAETTKGRVLEILEVQKAQAAQMREATAEIIAQGEALERQGQTIAENGASMDNLQAGLIGNSRVLGDIVGQLYAHYASISQATADFFASALTSANKSSNSVGTFLEALVRADQATAKLVANQQQIAANISEAYLRFADTGDEAFARIGNAIEGGSERLRAFADLAAQGKGNLKALDQASTQQLINSLDAAANKLDEINEKARRAKEEIENIGANAQDELDRANGNEAAIEDRRHKERLAQLAELRNQGGKDAQAAYADAVAKENALHQLRLANIQKEREARGSGNGGSSNPPPTAPPPTPPRPNNSGSSGQSNSSGGFGGPVNNITINGFVGSDAEETARKLKRMLDDLNRQGR